MEEADDLFNKNIYEEALLVYKEASIINPDEQYPKDMISKIDNLLAEEQEVNVEQESPYHIVVGSFQVKSNAIKLQQKLITKGYNSTLISRFDGGFNAVTYLSFADIHSAYNNLPPAQNLFDDEDVWVVYQK